jgi:hypothetical protein
MFFVFNWKLAAPFQTGIQTEKARCARLGALIPESGI